MPKVSVCIPSYNLAPFIGATIKSVLAQTYSDFELLIEDDGSTDNSLDVIAPFLSDTRITLVVKAKNEGQNRTTNSMVRAARGEYIALLPADDVWEPEKLAKQVAYLDANPVCGIVFGHPRFFNEEDGPLTYERDGFENLENAPRDQWQHRLKEGNCVFIATCLYRRSLHEELGYFNEELRLLADLEWYVRIAKGHDIHVIQEPLARIRQRNDMANLSAPTTQNMERNADELEMIRDLHYPVNRSKRKILVYTPFYDVKGYAPYIRSLVQTVYAMAKISTIDFEWNSVMGDSYIWRARNTMAQAFMDSDATELFFIDSDQGWSLEAFMRVLKHDVDIVGGAYPVKNNWEMYGVTFHTLPDTRPEVDESGLIRGDKVPTGFMKIKRRVFELLQKADPDNWYWEGNRKMFNYFGHIVRDHVAYGEDISFNMRWQDIGGKLWIEPRCDISHLGTKTWNGNLHEFLLKQPGGSNSTEPLPKAA